jgi:hypothetical protein
MVMEAVLGTIAATYLVEKLHQQTVFADEFV